MLKVLIVPQDVHPKIYNQRFFFGQSSIRGDKEFGTADSLLSQFPNLKGPISNITFLVTYESENFERKAQERFSHFQKASSDEKSCIL